MQAKRICAKAPLVRTATAGAENGETTNVVDEGCVVGIATSRFGGR